MTKSNILILFLGLTIIWIASSSIVGFSSSTKPFDWKLIAPVLKDSIVFMDNLGYIPNSIQGVNAKEPKGYNTSLWIEKEASIDDLENLLYYHESGTIKGIAAKGLLRKNESKLFKYLTYTLKQEVNVSYYHYCQQLGGYFLKEITAGVPENLNLFLNEKEVVEINKIIKYKDFSCK